jgi:hypothetical protein
MRCSSFIGGALVLVLVSSTSARAADAASTPQVSVGAFWSANLATVSSTPAPAATEARQWIGGGVTVDVPLGGRWSFDVRAMWNRKGATLTLANGSLFQKVHADYLSMPLLFKISSRGSVRGYAIAGPEISLRLNARVVTTLGTVTVDEDANDLTRGTDIAANAGAGLERDLGRSRLFVEALYSLGLRNVLKTTTPGEEMRTRTFTLLAGLRF